MLPTIDVHDLQMRLAEDDGDFVLLDCREVEELARAAIPGALHIPVKVIPARLHELDPAKTYGVLCHHGVRSALVCQYLQQQGFSNVLNVTGGIAAYARDVDPSVGTY